MDSNTTKWIAEVETAASSQAQVLSTRSEFRRQLLSLVNLPTSPVESVVLRFDVPPPLTGFQIEACSNSFAGHTGEPTVSMIKELRGQVSAQCRIVVWLRDPAVALESSLNH